MRIFMDALDVTVSFIWFCMSAITAHLLGHFTALTFKTVTQDYLKVSVLVKRKKKVGGGENHQTSFFNNEKEALKAQILRQKLNNKSLYFKSK